jgi:hypothetical protein
MEPGAKLYVVVDGTLAPGMQLSQSIHAARAFAAAHPALEADWFAASNTVAVLAARGERALLRLAADAAAFDVPCATFDEPDLSGRTTALALAPGPVAARLVRALPLALA